MTLVAGAVAGQDVRTVADTVATALGGPVAIAIPALGAPVLSPAGSLDAASTAAIAGYAEAVVAGHVGESPAAVGAAVPVRIAEQVVGVVAAPTALVNGVPDDECRAWLEAAAAAASVTALIRESHAGAASTGEESDLLAELSASQPVDLPAILTRARRLGIELGSGAVAVAARRDPGAGSPPAVVLRDLAVLVASRGPGRLLVLVPLSGPGTAGAHEVAERLRGQGWTVSCSGVRADPAQLHLAVLEAELLGELRDGAAAPAGQEDTYRLLIGVLLRDRDELHALCEATITPLADYDARHDTDLLATLHAFLAHDGSTTETAEAMQLHRHTVGYRLSRVHEVSGLSPYASDGRERLSLGIKARQILEAERRRS
jgi:hypothetical protein